MENHFKMSTNEHYHKIFLLNHFVKLTTDICFIKKGYGILFLLVILQRQVIFTVPSQPVPPAKHIIMTPGKKNQSS